MLLRLCQLKSLILILLLVSGGCSFRNKKQHQYNELVSSFNPTWFKNNPNHRLVNTEGAPVAHRFFDVSPDFSKDQKFANIVVTTPAGSPYHYGIDLSSGQSYFSHSFCPQSDVWNRENGTFYTPPFSIGFIPRILDQLGEPQKVIFFGIKDRVKRTSVENFFRAKIIGAYVEQTCPDGNCLGKANWLSRLVFIAVDPDEQKYSSVENIQDFQKEHRWSEIRAAIENLHGRNAMGTHFLPHQKVGNLISFDEALEFFNRNSIHMTRMETKDIRSSCHKLYDKLWKLVGEERPEDRAIKNVAELNEKVKLRNELKAKGKPVGFAQRFQKFTKKYADQTTTCSRFVYAGNLNHDSEKFWFLNHVLLFYRLHRDGYHFDCRRKAWQKTILDNRGEVTYDLKKDIESCGEKELDLAMGYLPNFLRTLKGNNRNYYKFIDYDNLAQGTHNKIYNWVKVDERQFECKDDPNLKLTRDARVYPEEIRWKPRDIKDIEKEMKIIY
jgi:hypothetical protein